MKKLWLMLFVLMIVTVVSSTAWATGGDVIGYIYSTDIRAYINGIEVKSYNIGGKTAVVIEDIIAENSAEYVYDDYSRTLKFFSLRPDCLVKKSSESKEPTGKIVGRIYATDIKTSIYDVIIPSYNIGGKTAVAIEDLGYDNDFSHIGGKFVWNEKERIISLEFLHSTYGNIPKDKIIKITANETMTEAQASFEEVFHCGGGQEEHIFPEHAEKGDNTAVLMPVKFNGEILGYYFYRSLANDDFIAFTYYYPEKIKEAEKTYIPVPAKTREEIIGHFVERHSVSEPRERFDTEDYSFVYISVAGTSWTSYNLLQAYDDGRYVDYADIISMRNRSPINLTIDKENEKVTFRHVDRYTSEWFTDYEINLKDGTIKQVQN